MRRGQETFEQGPEASAPDEGHSEPPQASGDASYPSGATTDIVKVSAQSRPSAVAGAIAGECRRHGSAEVQTIGAAALNQAIKAIVLARAFLRDDGFDMCCIPSFTSVPSAEQTRTGIRLLVVQHPAETS